MTTQGTFGVLTPEGPHEWVAKYVHSDGHIEQMANDIWRNYKRSYVNNLKGLADRLMSERLWYEQIVGKDFTLPTIWNEFGLGYEMPDIYKNRMSPSRIYGLTDEASSELIRYANANFSYCHSTKLIELIYAEFSLVGASACKELADYSPTNEEDDRVGINSSNAKYPPGVLLDVSRNVMIMQCYEGCETYEFNMDSDEPPNTGYWKAVNG